MTTWEEVLKTNDIDAVREFISSGADVNERMKDDETPLMRATLKGDIDIVKLLIEKGGGL